MPVEAYIVVGVLALIIGAVVVYVVLRFLKGQLTLSARKSACGPGESFSGTVEVLIKRPVDGRRLSVALVGYEEIRQRSGKHTRTTRREIFRNEVELEGARHYRAGFHEAYAFEVPAPVSQPATAGDTLAKSLETGINILTGRSARLLWRLEARLDAKGVDLSASKRVTVNSM